MTYQQTWQEARATQAASSKGDVEAMESDAQLVAAAREGDRAAFAELVGRHAPVLHAVCRRALGNSGLAEDAAQEATLQAWLNLDRLQQPERFGAWLMAIGMNMCHRIRRQRTRDAWSLEAMLGGRCIDGLVEARPGPEELAEAAELRAEVRRSIDGLPPGQRVAVLHFYLAGLTHTETAALLGISVGAVKTRLHKARRALYHHLSHTGKESIMDEQWNTDAAAEQQTTPQLASDTSAVEMRVSDVRRYRSPGSGDFVHVALLEEVGDTRVLPIWIGEFEATALALSLENVALPRPLTYAFAVGLLGASGGRLHEVRITRLQDTTFYAEAVVEGSAGMATVDARPSDALNLPLLAGVPIRVDATVLKAPVPEPSWATGDAAHAADLARHAEAKWSGARTDPD